MPALLIGLLCNAAAAQTTSPAVSGPAAGSGHWEAQDVGFAPWIFDLQIDGDSVTGTIGQGARDQATGITTSLTGPYAISDGEVDGDRIKFRAENGRTVVRFEGTISGDEIRFRRRVNFTGGYNGIFGGNGAKEFVARRGHADAILMPSILFDVRGMTVNLAAVQTAGDLDEMLDSLSRQIGIVERAVQDPEKLTFL